jgi:BMFP domain-containing protein YqiC
MQTRNTFLDDISKLMTNAAGVAQGVREEAETMVRSRFERFIADSNLVGREEFEAVRDMAQKAREENIALHARIAELEARLSGKGDA